MVQPKQDFRLFLEYVQRALMCLPLEQREALILIGCQGESYEAAAAVCGVSVVTITTRVNQACALLAVLLQMVDLHELCLDALLQTALQQPTAGVL